MDYTKYWDRTVGSDAQRSYKVCGKKEERSCKYCPGKVINFAEDTVYRCGIHGTIPVIKALN
jgi:hypothetical protein